MAETRKLAAFLRRMWSDSASLPGPTRSGHLPASERSQGRALDALRKGAQGLAQSMQQQMGQGPGPGRSGRLGQPRAQQETDPLGRPLRGREYGDDYTVKVPGEIDVQRARRIIEELRRRFGDVLRPQEELDYNRAALEGLLSNATSRTSSRAPARLPASEILLLGVAAEFRCGSY